MLTAMTPFTAIFKETNGELPLKGVTKGVEYQVLGLDIVSPDGVDDHTNFLLANDDGNFIWVDSMFLKKKMAPKLQNDQIGRQNHNWKPKNDAVEFHKTNHQKLNQKWRPTPPCTPTSAHRANQHAQVMERNGNV